MEIVELHFFHGFLGAPADWELVQEFVSGKEKFKFVNHNLVEDYANSADDKSLVSWAELKNNQLQKSSNKKIIIGYSLGGRLALHLNSKSYQAALLLGVHPGLFEGRVERSKSDQAWVERAKETSVEEWLQTWDGQEVFKNDRCRPERKMTAEQLSEQLALLQSWSLSKQEVMDEKIKENSEKIYWACGDNDEKFTSLKNRFSSLLPSNHIKKVSSAGHGVLFEQPQKVAEILMGVIEDVD